MSSKLLIQNHHITITSLILLITRAHTTYSTHKSQLQLSNNTRALNRSASAISKLHKMSETSVIKEIPQVQLSTDGVYIPIIGLGTWKAHPDEINNIVEAAIDVGYRHFDTAFNYNTEEAIGDALQRLISEGKVKREELFITTKLPVFGNRASDVGRFLTMSLAKLKMEYVDLYLIHMPFAFACDNKTYQPAKNDDGTVKLDVDSNPLDTWQAMEQEVIIGRAKTIGLSNFNIKQVQKVYENARIKPALLQVELHAYNQQKELIAACRKLNIAVTAYAPLGSPRAKNHFQEKYEYIRDIPELLSDPTVKEIAERLQKTPGQILLRHLTQRNVVVIPKSSNPDRLKQNIQIMNFDLSESDLDLLDALDQGEKGRIFDFKFFKGVDCHPEYPFESANKECA